MIGLELEDAIKLLCENVDELTETERLPLSECGGRILAQDITAPLDNPPFPRSPLDGYAVLSADIASATRVAPVLLRVVGKEYAGEFFAGTLHAGQALRLMTGAPLPPGCDCVVRQEDSDYGEDTVQIYAPVGPLENYCFKGEDIKAGTLLLHAGERLNFVRIGVLASMGFCEVLVKRRTRAALISTGDEICDAPLPLLPGKIYNSNMPLLRERLHELGLATPVAHRACDSAEVVAAAVHNALSQCDVVLTTGGVSVGQKDIMHKVLELLGAERLFWQIKMKPGSPLLTARVEGKLLLCLSGNPFAALTSFEVFARPVFARLGGDASLLWHRKEALLLNSFSKPSPSRRLVRATFEDGTVQVPTGNHASGALLAMTHCNALIDIPAGTEALQKGQSVSVICL